jgi:hypothetical protein
VTSTTSAELPLDERDPSKLGHGADPRPVSTAPATLDTEANAVADALCARKYSCDEIGPNRPFVTREECMAEAIRDARRSLSTMACPHGTMERQTTSCLEAVRAEACSPVLDVTTGIGACQPEVICAP